MHNISLQRALRTIPDGRKTAPKLPDFVRTASEETALRRLAKASGLDATERELVAKFNAPGHCLTQADRKCIRHMIFKHFGVWLNG